MNETTMMAFERMLKERFEYFQSLWDENDDGEALTRAYVYQSVIDMFQYAKNDDRAALAQFDYFGKEEEDYEPADIDDDCGFDPYEGCYTYDC